MKQVNSYHREDLRGELITAARRFIDAFGHEDLSVRKLAQLVQVSAGAPYHHFPDRRSLLLAVALQGYDEMTALGERAIDAVANDEDRLYEICSDFLQFASEHPRLFSLMYESELTRPALEPAIARAQFVGFGILRNAVVPMLGNVSSAEIGVRIATLWSAIYGFALLRDRHMIQPHDEIKEPASIQTADAIVRQAMRILA